MSNEHNTDSQRQPGQYAQQGKSDHKHHAGQHDDQEKSPKGYDTKKDTTQQEKAGKGKIATSTPGGSESDDKRD